MIDGSLTTSAIALVVSAIVLIFAGVRLTHDADELAARTALGAAMAGAVLLGATTSLPGLVTTIVGAASDDAGFAVGNAMGGIAAQTVFLAIADLSYRRVNLEHAAASISNLVQTMVLVALIGIVLAASAGPDVTLFAVHPATVLLVVGYGYGLMLARRAQSRPMWRPERTVDTVDEPEDDGSSSRSLRRVGAEFAALAVVVALTGWVVGRAGLSIAAETGLSGSVVGALLTGVLTSLPELVTVLAAVRIGAVTLAVGDIIGGNTFDVLFVAAADVAFRSGSVYHGLDGRSLFLAGLTVVLTAVLAIGMIEREKRHIGFEGVAMIVLYAVGVVALAVGA